LENGDFSGEFIHWGGGGLMLRLDLSLYYRLIWAVSEETGTFSYQRFANLNYLGI
jgi:hypothetical protein